MTIEDLKNRMKAASFQFEGNDGITYEPDVTLEDVLSIIDEFELINKYNLDEDQPI